MRLELIEIPFIKAVPFLVNNDPSGIGGEDNVGYFSACWKEATNTPRDSAIMSVENTIEYHRIQVLKVQIMVDLLSIAYVPEFIEMLREEGYNYEFTQESYLADLKNVVAEAQTSMMAFEEAVKDREDMIKRMGSSQQADFEYYSTLTNLISKHAGFAVSIEINCQQWAGYYKELFTPKLKKSEQRTER